MGFTCNILKDEHFEIKNFFDYNNHMKNVHPYKNQKFLKEILCPLCPREYREKDNKFWKSKNDFEEHLARRHKEFVQDILPSRVAYFEKKNANSRLKYKNEKKATESYSEFSEIQPGTSQLLVQNYEIQQIFTNTRSSLMDYEVIEELNINELNEDDDNMNESSEEINENYTEDDIPYYQKERRKFEENNDKNKDVFAEFGILLKDVKHNTKITQCDLNLISGLIVNYFKNKQEEIKNNPNFFDELLKICKSKHRQESYCNPFNLVKEDNFYKIKLSEVVENYLKNDEICQELFHEHSRKKDGKILKTINDVDRYRMQPKKKNEIKILINYYIDDYDNRRMNKGKSDNTKVTVIYCSIGNIRYEFQSKREQISLLGICMSKYLKADGIDERTFKLEQFYASIIDDLKNINNIPFVLENAKKEKFICKIEIGLINADNLAMNQLTSLKCSFNATACCIYCMGVCRATGHHLSYKNDEQTITNLDQNAQPRNLTELNHIFKDFEDQSFLYVVDIFHDLNEGVILAIMNTIISNCDHGLISEKVNELHQEYKYDLPAIFKDHMSGTGAQYMNFFYVFSYINEFYSCENHLYKLYLILRKIINFVLHYEVHVDDLDEFDKDVEKFFELCEDNGIKLTPKAHHMKHYSHLMRNTGPLNCSSTVKYERKHQDGKKSISNSNNRKNLAYSLGNFYSFKNTNTNFKKLNNNETFIFKENFKNHEILSKYLEYFDNDMDLYLCKKFFYKKKVFEKKCFYIKSLYDSVGLPTFFEIELIIRQKQDNLTDKIIILGKEYEVDQFSQTEYLLNNSNLLNKLEFDKTPYYKKLIYYKKDERVYICKNFYISPLKN